MRTKTEVKKLIEYWKSYKGNKIKISNGALINASDLIVYWQDVYNKILEIENTKQEVADAIDVLNKYYALINEND